MLGVQLDPEYVQTVRSSEQSRIEARRRERERRKAAAAPPEFDGDSDALLAVPFDERLLALGAHRCLALSLFEGGQLTLSQAAKVAGLTLDAFLDLLGEAGIAAVDYPPEDLARDLKHAL